MEEKGQGGSPPLQIDPECLHDALRAFFKPIKNDDPRLDFYTVYKREATDYDTDYVKKYDEDLNITLIFAGLFSAVSSAFVIAVQTNLQPDPNQQSAAILRLILLTLNQSAIPNESLAVPPVQEDPPPEIVTASGLMYSSLLISLLAAFVAMLGKQWLNRYLRHAGGSMIERCGDRQRKCDGLQEWPFHLFIESLPVMLQVALLLLTCGLCQYMASINTPISGVLIALTALGVLFYLAIVVAGTSSYACPFQTPGSTALHGQWKKVRPYTTPLVHLIVTAGAYVFKVLSSNILHPLWKKIVFQIGSSIHRFKRAVMRIALDLDKRVRVTFRSLRYGHPQSPVVSLEGIREDSCMSSEPNSSPHNSSRHNLDPPSREIDSSSQSTRASEPWLVRGALATIQKTNTKDIRCVSWILRNITDPEALDAAIRLAGTILWFEDGTDVDPPYDIIVSTLHTCFDSTGAVYPGLSDRAYYSVRAILWIRICGMCQGEEFARGSFYLPYVSNNRSYNTDLDSILEIYNCTRAHRTFIRNGFTEHNTPEHMQWVSRTFLHSCWAKQKFPYGIFVSIYRWIQNVPWNVIPLGATLDLFLVWTMFLGCPIQEEALKIQDKTICLKRVASQLSRAVVAAIPASHPCHPLLRGMLLELAKWENRPNWLRTMAYKWCSAICEEYQDLEDARELLFLSLKIGFRGLGVRDYFTDAGLVHTKQHRHMADIVFNSGNGEVIADLLQAWTVTYNSSNTRELVELVSILPMYLIHLQHEISTSQTLRRLVIRSVEHLGPEQVERVGVEEFAALLDRLDVGVDDTDSPNDWLRLLRHFVRSSQGRHFLPRSYWELMVELSVTTSWSWLWDHSIDGDLQVMFSLEEEEKWDTLECWSGFVWLRWLPKIDTISYGLERVTLALFRQRPGAVQKLEQWMRRSHMPDAPECLECLRWICERGGFEVVSPRDIPSISSPVAETGAHARSPSSALQLLARDDTY